MNENIEKPTMKLPPLKRMCMTIGQLPASYVETMSYYEMLVWFVHYLRDDVIPVVNANGEAVEELQELYVQLQEYVNNYFDNLDVQEEINNKLDEMAEDGTLEELILHYINIPRIYNTINDMINMESPNEGETVTVLGYYSVNDGGKASYLITADPTGYNLSLNNSDTLKAQLIYEDVINAKQLGLKENENSSTIIQTLINNFNNIFIPKGTYILESDVTLKSNLTITGEDGTIFKSNDSSFKNTPNNQNMNIYKYTITGEESNLEFFKLTIDSTHYYLQIPSDITLSAGDIIYINPYYNLGIINSNHHETENELTLLTPMDYTDITNSCVVNSRLIPTSEKLTNVIIDNISFEYQTNAQTKYAIYLNNVENIQIKNCNVSKNGLVYITLSTPVVSTSTTEDGYVLSGFNTKLLNKNIEIKNNKVIGKTVNLYNYKNEIPNNTAAGMWLAYVDNITCENNTIKYLQHGISIWGGNVGPNNYNREYMLRFANNIKCINNTIQIVRMGGIWTSRSSQNIVTNNIIEVTGDVGIDFEGSKSCIASNNVSNDSINGALAILYMSYDIIFDSNTCVDNGINSTSKFMLANNNDNDYRNKIIFSNNTFNSKYKMIRAGRYVGSTNGIVKINNNIFKNCYIELHQINNMYCDITNNVFTGDSGLDLSEFTAFIHVYRANVKFFPRANISGNTFNVTYNDGNYGTYKNNSDYDNKYAIAFTGGAWGIKNSLIVENNKIYGFNNAILLNHQKFSDNDTQSALYMNLSNNFLTGAIDNLSDARGVILYDNNKTIFNGSSNEYKLVPINIPNAIPTATDYGSYEAGTKIYFDLPDANGYIGAICTVSGNPGTWKRFGQIES